VRNPVQLGLGRHYHSRGVKSTLHPGMDYKGFLDRVERVAIGKPLDGRDLLPVCFHGRYQATVHALTHHDDRTGAALAFTAPSLVPVSCKSSRMISSSVL
ncbi:MAG: hypothetical protein QGG48_04305, partial [Desulfatiglandales bacterium]|nr:hypothetical protein [Desulfatiglandales bacterium]